MSLAGPCERDVVVISDKDVAGEAGVAELVDVCVVVRPSFSRDQRRIRSWSIASNGCRAATMVRTASRSSGLPVMDASFREEWSKQQNGVVRLRGKLTVVENVH